MTSRVDQLLRDLWARSGPTTGSLIPLLCRILLITLTFSYCFISDKPQQLICSVDVTGKPACSSS